MTCRHALGEVSALTCYVRGCRENRCRDAGNRYQQKRRRVDFDGLVPAGPVREHLLALAASGMRMRSIAAVTGLNRTLVSHIHTGRSRKVTAVTAQAILSVTSKPDSFGTVDAVGARRRLQALAIAGWGIPDLADRCRVGREGLRQIRAGKARIEVRTHRAIAELYDQLWDRKPLAETGDQRRASSRVHSLAVRAGWVGALAWDDDEIDDPKSRPRSGKAKTNRVIVDEVAVERLKRGERVPVNKIEQRTAIAELAAARVPTAEIADRLAMSLSSAIRTRNRITAERRTA